MAEYIYKFSRDNKPRLVNNWIVGFTCIFSMLDLYAPQLFGQAYPSQFFGIYPPAVWSGEYWRVLTVMLVHGNAFHLAMNMVALWSIGRIVEEKFGWKTLISVYLASNFFGAALVLLFESYGLVTIGASGGVLGLLAFLIAWMVSRAGGIRPVWNSPLGRALMFPLLATAAISLLPRVSLFGHLGGVLGGALIGFMIERRMSKRFELREQIAAMVLTVLAIALFITGLRPVHKPEYALNRAADALGMRLTPTIIIDDEEVGSGASPLFRNWRATRDVLRQESDGSVHVDISKEEMQRAKHLLESTSHEGISERGEKAWEELTVFAALLEFIMHTGKWPEQQDFKELENLELMERESWGKQIVDPAANDGAADAPASDAKPAPEIEPDPDSQADE